MSGERSSPRGPVMRARSADDTIPATHVGVASCRPLLTSRQRGELGRVLASLTLNRDTQLVLHHGCGPGADEVAHHVVRKLGGWRIHGHPSPAATDGLSRSARHTIGDLDVVHGSKPGPERDADIVSASQILVAVPAFPEDNPQSSQSRTWTMVHLARTAGLEIIYVPQTRRTLGSAVPPEPIPGQGTVTAPTKTRDVTWAARRGRLDRKAGTACRGYQQFCGVYGLNDSKLTRQMWTAYAPKAPKRKKRAKARSVWTVSGGLPTLGKRAR